MQQLSILINKYREGNASVKELYELLRLLDEHEHDLYNQWQSDIKTTLAASVINSNLEGSKAVILTKIKQKVAEKPERIVDVKVKRFFHSNLAIAAACIGLLVMISLYYLSNKAVVENEQQFPVYAASNTTIIHTGAEQKSIWLTDSSEVLLYEGSTLSYDSAYNTTLRKLVLNGKARFTVKKDKQRPFIVYTKNNSTTALGTVFEVTQTGDSTIVHLLEGSVSVQSLDHKNKEQVQLLPQQKSLSFTDRTVIIKELPEKDTPHLAKEKSATKNMGSLQFKQATLEQVFTTLSDKYKVEINYNKTDITGMLFTGTFSGKEALPQILNIIVRINNLTITAGEQDFSITK